MNRPWVSGTSEAFAAKRDLLFIRFDFNWVTLFFLFLSEMHLFFDCLTRSFHIEQTDITRCFVDD